MGIKIAILIPLWQKGSGGFSKHLAEVTQRLIQKPDVKKIVVYSNKNNFSTLKDINADLRHIGGNDSWFHFQAIGREVEKEGCDVAFCVTSRQIRLNGVPLVTMVRNAEPIQKAIYPMPLLWQLRRWALWLEFKQACQSATRIIAVSQYVKNQIEYNLGIKKDKIDVVYHGFDQSETRNACQPAEKIPNEAFIFSAGSLTPYRGFEDLIRALAILREQGKMVPRVVFAGQSILLKSYERWIKRLPVLLGVGDRVTWAGHFNQFEMAWCFQNSLMFVQTSRAESFSNLQLEAVGNHCLVVACNHAPMPEILDDAGIYYDIGNVHDLARKISFVLTMNQEETAAQKRKLLKRAMFFSWDKTAEQTLLVLNRAVQEFHRDRHQDKFSQSDGS